MRTYRIKSEKGNYDLTYEAMKGESYRLALTLNGQELDSRYYPSYIDMVDRGLRWAQTIARNVRGTVEG